MTTSGDTTYSVTAQSIIRGSLLDMRALAPGQTLDAGEYTDCLDVLNQMVLSWQAAGVGLWLNQLAALHLTVNKQSYLLGPSGDRCGINFGATPLASAALAGTHTLIVTDVSSTAGHIDNGDAIGIQLDDGTLQWTTVNGAPVGETVTITAALSAAAAAGNMVFTYDKLISRPLGIVEARLRDSSNIDTPLEVIARLDYMQLPLKSSSGNPNQVYYDPQLTNGVLYNWSTTNTVANRIIMTIKTPVQDFVAIGNEPQFPREWFLALRTNLSVWLSPMYQVNPQEFQRLALLAKTAYDQANDFDREQASTQFVPYYEPSRR